MNARGDGRIKTDALKALLTRAVEAKEQTGEINKDVAFDKKAAIALYGLHGRAFNLCVTLARMEQVKRIAFLEALDSYRHILNLDDAPQGELEKLARELTKDGTTVTVLRGAGR